MDESSSRGVCTTIWWREPAPSPRLLRTYSNSRCNRPPSETQQVTGQVRREVTSGVVIGIVKGGVREVIGGGGGRNGEVAQNRQSNGTSQSMEHGVRYRMTSGCEFPRSVPGAMAIRKASKNK